MERTHNRIARPKSRHTLRCPWLVAALLLSSVVFQGQSATDSDPAGTLGNDLTVKQSTDSKTKNIFGRFIQAYRQDQSGQNDNEPEAPRRIPPAPLTSPPFPSADWN
jgi:hypothetical protein